VVDSVWHQLDLDDLLHAPAPQPTGTDEALDSATLQEREQGRISWRSLRIASTMRCTAAAGA
jgi:hypothetical protein